MPLRGCTKIHVVTIFRDPPGTVCLTHTRTPMGSHDTKLRSYWTESPTHQDWIQSRNILWLGMQYLLRNVAHTSSPRARGVRMVGDMSVRAPPTRAAWARDSVTSAPAPRLALDHQATMALEMGRHALIGCDCSSTRALRCMLGRCVYRGVSTQISTCRHLSQNSLLDSGGVWWRTQRFRFRWRDPRSISGQSSTHRDVASLCFVDCCPASAEPRRTAHILFSLQQEQLHPRVWRVRRGACRLQRRCVSCPRYCSWALLMSSPCSGRYCGSGPPPRYATLAPQQTGRC